MQCDLAIADNAAKELTALHRAIPKTRMLDYGMAVSDATAMDALTIADETWHLTAESLAESRLRQARTHTKRHSRATAFAEAAAAFNIAQLAFSKDVPDKRTLYRRFAETLDELADEPNAGLSRLAVNSGGHVLHGWELRVSNPVGCVIIIGGLSGWGASYLGMARALAMRRISTLMAEAPGQGDTRMVSALHLSRAALVSLRAVVDTALSRSSRIGVVGNSFGGLIAAHLSAATTQVTACCINGAAPRIKVPEFRTVREQMEAAAGCEGADLVRRLEELEFDHRQTPLRCPTLILEGGLDPIVAPGIQAEFLNSPPPVGTLTRSWADGEHTIYNHADQRNALLADWFLEQFTHPMSSIAGRHDA